MKNIFLLFILLLTVVSARADVKHDLGVVKKALLDAVGKQTIDEIKKREGGEKFLKAFLDDRDWMEQFLGSGRPGVWMGDKNREGTWGQSLKALDLLVWNDKNKFIQTKVGRNIATSFALNHAHDWDDEKLVEYMACYRDWHKDGTLDDSCYKLDTWGWREVTNMGQNTGLPVEAAEWIHDYANVPPEHHYGVCHQSMAYRLWNCFGASVHGSDYYYPWKHRWNEQQLRFRVGGVCGAISKFGSHCAAVHGIRAYTAGQPGHCAYMLWDFKVNHWGLGNAVTSHTSPHFTLGGHGLAANEEQDRYYKNPKRLDAEYLRLQGKYEESMKLVPGNWNAAYDWYESLKMSNAKAEDWAKFSTTLLETFKTEPGQGWELYMKYLETISDRQRRIAEAKKGLLNFTENPSPTFEAMYFDEKVLEPLFKILGDGDDAVWKLLPAALDGQAASKNYYPAIINWGAEKLMKGPEGSKKFLKLVGNASLKHKRELDYRGMILTAAQSGDLLMFKQVYKLLDKLSPQLAPKKTGKNYPEKDYGDQPLVSDKGLMRISKSGGYDTPINYRNVINAEEFAGGNGFHTDKDDSPYVEIMLPGEVEVTGVTIVNSGSNGNNARQVPLEVSVSGGDGRWQKVWSSNSVQDVWNAKLPKPTICKLVRVGRTPEAKTEVFHLHKVLVYGRPLF